MSEPIFSRVLKMLVNCRDSGISVEIIKSLLKESHLPFEIPEVNCRRIESWIKNPNSAIECEQEVLEAIFGPSLIICYLSDPDAEANVILFSNLVCKVETLNEMVDATWFSIHDSRKNSEINFENFRKSEGAKWQRFYAECNFDIVKFNFRNIDYVFYVEACLARLDINSIMCNFDAFMKLLGRKERVFRINVIEHWWDDGAVFIVGAPSRLEKLMDSLGLSGRRAAPEKEPTLHVR